MATAAVTLTGKGVHWMGAGGGGAGLLIQPLGTTVRISQAPQPSCFVCEGFGKYLGGVAVARPLASIQWGASYSISHEN